MSSKRLQNKGFNRIVARNIGNPNATREALLREAGGIVGLLPFLDRLDPYFDIEETRTLIREAMGHGDATSNLLKHTNKLRGLFNDEELRAFLIDIHKKYPWLFYTAESHLETVFSNDFYKRLLDQGIGFTKDPDLFKIFLLFNAATSIDAYEDRITKLLSEFVEGSITNVSINDSKEPGFACGGLEENYRAAARQGEGLCVVNRELLAKVFHRKGKDKAKKATLIPRRCLRSSSGKVLWSNFVYAPSEGSHQSLMSNIALGKKEVDMDILSVRPVRPLIGLTSDEIFSMLG